MPEGTQELPRAALRCFVSKQKWDSAILHRLSGGYSNDVWRVETDTKIFVLKRFSSKFSRQQILNSVTAQSHLAEERLAPQLHPTENGTLFLEQGDAMYTLSDFIETQTTFSVEAAGKLLGLVHRCLFEFNKGDSLPTLTIAGHPFEEISRMMRFFSHSPKICLELATRSYRIQNVHEATVRGAANLPTQWIHGDFWTGNIVGSNGSLCVIDLDQVTRYPRVYEVMRGFFASPQFRASPVHLLDNLSLFIRAYHDIFRLHTDEFDHGLDFFLWVQMCDIAGYKSANAAEVEYCSARFRMCDELYRMKTILLSAVSRQKLYRVSQADLGTDR